MENVLRLTGPATEFPILFTIQKLTGKVGGVGAPIRKPHFEGGLAGLVLLAATVLIPLAKATADEIRLRCDSVDTPGTYVLVVIDAAQKTVDYGGSKFTNGKAYQVQDSHGCTWQYRQEVEVNADSIDFRNDGDTSCGYYHIGDHHGEIWTRGTIDRNNGVLEVRGVSWPYTLPEDDKYQCHLYTGRAF